MPYSISVFIGNQMNTEQGTIQTYENFEDLANPFMSCRKGKKHSAYFVRGALEPMKRENANLKESSLLIIDADVGIDGGNAPSPGDVSAELKMRRVNHFIYTSHSHAESQNKYRVVIPTNRPFVNGELKDNMIKLLRGLGIGWVKEMGVMSQPWFTPTRDDPNDGLFYFDLYTEGQPWEIDNVKESKDQATPEEPAPKPESREGVETLDQLYENVRSGSELHESLLTISYQLVKDGMSKAHAKSMLRTIMNGSELAGTERWLERFNDIERMVDRVVDGSGEDFDLEHVPKSGASSTLPRPPGMLGELEQACYDSLLYQYREVSLVSALGLIAGIAGRKFNVITTQRTGLNLYLTLVADTGAGKDGINRFINGAIRKSVMDTKDAVNDTFTSFIGPASFTGAKGIFKAFKNARSRVCVMSEAGLMMKVKSGDQEGKSAALLNAYNESGSDSWTRFHVYSNEDDNIESLRAIAPTIISESTPGVLMEAYQSIGALATGYLPRQMVFKIAKRQTRMNRKVVDVLPGEVKDRLHDLLETCAQVQAHDDPMAYDMVFADDLIDDVFDYNEKYNAISEENTGVDTVKQHMATRIGLKVIRVAAVATVINKVSSDERALIIDKQEWEWAKELCDYEFEHITESLGGLAGNQSMDNACWAVYSKMEGIIENTIKDKKCQIDIRYRKRKIIPYSNLKIACKNNPAITEINDRSGQMKAGLDKVITHMVENKAIKIWDKDPLGGRSPKLIQVLEGINDYVQHFGV